jgi:hypothetical protein
MPFFPMVISAGRRNIVAAPANNNIADIKTPTVLYGISGAASKGIKPTPITMHYRFNRQRL